MDGIELEILWSNLIGIVSEQAKALQRIAFSPIVREAGDLASGLFDGRGRMVAQANTGTPGLNGMGSLMQGYLETSNVNVVQELVSMIQTQRAYEMNSQAITTSNQMLQRLVTMAQG